MSRWRFDGNVGILRPTWPLVIGLLLLASGPPAHAQCTGDFNGDGFDDLAIGAPNETVNGATGAGAVNVLYGSPSLLTTSPAWYLHQDVTRVNGVAENDDRFGAALAAGDFNGDGYDDLAVGVPGETIGSVSQVSHAGAVQIFYGGSLGLRIGGNHILHKIHSGITGQTDDGYASSLAAGDFNRDGYDDLAIGIPKKDVGSPSDVRTDAGGVIVVYGCPDGLGSDCGGEIDQYITENGLGGSLSSVADDQFGTSLAAGDFDGDGFDDLAIGVPNDDSFSGGLNAGAAWVVYGSSAGLGGHGSQSSHFWHQDRSGVEGVAEPGDRFGASLAAGDFNGDGFDDLAIGVPSEDVGGATNAGAVNVLFGSASGLTAAGDQVLTQAGSDSENNDFFGVSLAAGDATGDGRSELVVGAHGEDSFKGAVHAFRGTSSGLSRLQVVSARVAGGAQPGDYFGASLAMGDFDGNGRCDLAVGAPVDTVSGVWAAGSVTILAPGFVQFFHKDTPGVGGAPGQGSQFGRGLSKGNP
jgi:hypothetical protein